ILRRSDFSNKLWLDRVVGTGVAWHEGQLFGWLNQLIGLLSAMGLLLLCFSSVVLWWRRRAVGVLGAPKPSRGTRRSIGLSLIVLSLAIFLPLFGASLLAVRLLERLVLRQIRPVAQWLGLSPSAAIAQ
ncbi:MAG: PepSY domain-containing protein, partial [Tepidisphaeraceae bacterium]